jgi:hypothetical protein
MTSDSSSSGRSCRRTDLDSFLGCTGYLFFSGVDPEHFICSEEPEGRWRVRLTIVQTLVQGIQAYSPAKEIAYMKSKVIWIVALLVVLPAVIAAEKPPGTAATKYTLTVLNPQGPVKKSKDLAPRLGALEGKKIAMWLSSTADQVYAGRGAELYDALAKMLQDKFPGVQIVPYTALPMKFAPENEIVAAITAVKPDGVVAGFGG